MFTLLALLRNAPQLSQFSSEETPRRNRISVLAVDLATSALDADALSTAVFVLGPHDGIALLDRTDGVEGMLVTKGGEVQLSRGFQALSVRNT